MKRNIILIIVFLFFVFVGYFLSFVHDKMTVPEKIVDYDTIFIINHSQIPDSL
jgi:hypothetical protein